MTSMNMSLCQEFKLTMTITIPDINITINDTTMNRIRQENPVENDGNYGIDVFSSALHIFH